MNVPKPQALAFRLFAKHPFPEVVIYMGCDFEGESWRTNLSYSYVGEHWSELIASVIIVAGIWEFWSGPDFTENCFKLGSGYYPSIRGECRQAEFKDKGILSFRCVSQV